MINAYTVMGIWFNIFVNIILPIVAVFTLVIKKNVSLTSVLSGGATFFIAQMVILSPLLGLIRSSIWFRALVEKGDTAIFSLILLAVLTALVVEFARYLSIRYTIGRQYTSFRNVVGFTLGFVFLESLLLVGIPNAQNLYFSLLIQNGGFQVLVNQMGVERANAALATLQGINGDTLFMLGTERLLMLVVQAFLTTFAFLAIKFNRQSYFFVALVTHFAINLATAIVGSIFSAFASFVLLAICAVGFFGFLMDIPKVFSGQITPVDKNTPPKKQ